MTAHTEGVSTGKVPPMALSGGVTGTATGVSRRRAPGRSAAQASRLTGASLGDNLSRPATSGRRRKPRMNAPAQKAVSLQIPGETASRTQRMGADFSSRLGAYNTYYKHGLRWSEFREAHWNSRFTQVTGAVACGVSRKTYQRWLSGNRPAPSYAFRIVRTIDQGDLSELSPRWKNWIMNSRGELCSPSALVFAPGELEATQYLRPLIEELKRKIRQLEQGMHLPGTAEAPAPQWLPERAQGSAGWSSGDRQGAKVDCGRRGQVNSGGRVSGFAALRPPVPLRGADLISGDPAPGVSGRLASSLAPETPGVTHGTNGAGPPQGVRSKAAATAVRSTT